MDRSIAPNINQIEDIKIPHVDKDRLECGIDIFYVHDSKSEAFKIEAVHKGGFSHLPNASASVLLNKMLLEGTKSNPGKSFLDEVDALGSFMEASPSFDNGMLSLFGLSRFFEKNVSLLAAALYEAEFSEDRLIQLKKKDVNRIRLNKEKGSYLTSTQLRKCLFGAHPYGFTAEEKDVSTLALKSLKTFYNTHIQSFDLFLAGNLPEDFIEILNRYFQVKPIEVEIGKVPDLNEIPQANFELRDAKYLQSSIRLGMKLFNRHHKDYSVFMLLNEIYGGYFGSRLMKNIREDKGYTYGISSHLYALKETGYFTIGTEVNKDAEEDTLAQIAMEMETLRDVAVPKEELSTVKNYILGGFANSLSAPFAAIDKFKALRAQGLDLSFYEGHLTRLKLLSSQEVQEAANTYLHFDRMTSSIVGNT